MTQLIRSCYYSDHSASENGGYGQPGNVGCEPLDEPDRMEANAYEAERERNIARNRSVLLTLGVDSSRKEFIAATDRAI